MAKMEKEFKLKPTEKLTQKNLKKIPLDHLDSSANLASAMFLTIRDSRRTYVNIFGIYSITCAQELSYTQIALKMILSIATLMEKTLIIQNIFLS